MLNFFLTILSPLILILAFPKFNVFPLAWIGLVPLLFALENQSLKKSFFLSYLSGFIFYGVMIHWLGHVTPIGAGMFIAYLALYFAFFGVGVHFSRRFTPLFKALFLSAFWILLEYIRNWAFSGFGWAALGQSQAVFLPIIQIADIVGMHGVTFLIVLANVCLAEIAKGVRPLPVTHGVNKVGQSASVTGNGLTPLKAVTVILCLLSFGYGLYRLKTMHYDEHISVGVVQANIKQEEKWQQRLWPRIMDKHLVVTQALLAEKKVDLVIWPETSYPGILWDDIELFQDLVVDMRALETPLLLGAAMLRNDQYFNSAILLNKRGSVETIYDKLHLVPFGEFVPFREILPFLADIVPIGDFTAGNEYTVFDLPERSVQFATLICFEDTVSHLARGFVANGAQFLVNITNDAWFGETKAPFLHVSSAVFRAIENRRSLVRSANTGLSVFIGPSGEVVKIANQAGDPTFVQAFAHHKVALSNKITFFNRFPELFAYFCFTCVLSGLIYRIRNKY